MLRTEVATARLLTLQCVACHQLAELQEVSQTQCLLQLNVERISRTYKFQIRPELLAQSLNLNDCLLQRLLGTSHTYVVPHNVAQTLVDIVNRLLTLDSKQLLDLLLNSLLCLVKRLGSGIYLRSLNLCRQVVANGVGQYEVTVSQTLHQSRSTQTVSTVIREVSLANCVQTGDSSHQVVVNPDTTHRVVNSGEDLHRLLVRTYVGDLLIHIEQVTIASLDNILTQTLDSGLEIEEYSQTGLIYTVACIATLLCCTRCNVARYEVTECGVATLQVVVAILLGDLRRLNLTCAQSLNILHLLGNPDTTVVTQRLRHQRQLRLLGTVDRNTGGVNLREAGVSKTCTLAIALECC